MSNPRGYDWLLNDEDIYPTNNKKKNSRRSSTTAIKGLTSTPIISNNELEDKRILDVACGGRMFWFDKQHPNTLFVDKRVMQPTKIGHGINQRTRKCLPDVVMDFRKLDLPDNHFSLVVFDPPHLILGSEKSYMANAYGILDKDNWRDDLTKGFAECFRVLKPDGVLIFKWHEFDVPLKEILALTPHKPLFGHKSGKAQLTHWVTFMKPTPPYSN